MQSISKIFQELKNQSSIENDSFSIAGLPSIKNHKIGVSQTGQPMFFIKCDDSFAIGLLDSNLEFIAVQFNRQCLLINEEKQKEEGIYTILLLKTDSFDLQEYFLEVVFILIKNLPEQPTLNELKIEMGKLINLFNKFSKTPIKTVQGLWAELLVIEQAKDCDYLIQSWHKSIYDTHDFNNGTDKIEVKSTTKNRRVHSFSMDQLKPNEDSKLIIVSILITEIGIGSSIFDLINKIEKKIRNKDLIFQINEVVAETLGRDFEKAFDIFYDYQLAKNSIEYYDSIDIPIINFNNIPSNIMNIRFDCDLTDVRTIKDNNLISNLYCALF